MMAGGCWVRVQDAGVVSGRSSDCGRPEVVPVVSLHRW